LKIEAIDNQSGLYPRLQDFVSQHQLLFNSRQWLQNYSSDQVVQCAILNNNREIIGCFVYYRFKKSIFSFAISPPYSPSIDLFYINPSVSVVGKNSFTKEVLDEVAAYFDTLGVSDIDINLPDQVVDTQPFIWKGYVSRTRYSYLLDLSLSQEQLWDNLASEKRKSINKASKDGLRIAQVQDLQLVYPLVLQSLERNGQDKNTAIIKNILFSYASPANSFAYIAYYNDLPIGASFCVINKNKAIYLFGGFDAGNKHHGAGVSCMWHSILKAKDMNLAWFDFEGSMNPAIERYYREFGGKLVPFYNLRKTKLLVKILMTLKGHHPL
jgi:hypothetical protein